MTSIFRLSSPLLMNYEPGQMIQTVEEILELVIEKKPGKGCSNEILSIINLRENKLIHASIKYATDETGAINIVASLFKDELVHFKCKAKLVLE